MPDAKRIAAGLRAVLGRLNLTLLGLTILVATFWFTDRITNRQPPAPRIVATDVQAKHAALANDVRVFVYVIDSLRYENAIDPEIMPNLCALRREGAWARVTARFNSVTGPALRDAFTGRENAAVLGAVATFIHNDVGVESLFHQMALQGLTTAAYSDGFFRQFGAGIQRLDEQLGRASPHDAQERHVLAAVEALRSGEYNFVIGHLPYTDTLAHERPVGSPEYREGFHRADALIPLIRARLPKGATLVVMGDHGHDLAGRHGMGLNVPTIALYVGERFRAGVDLGSMSIMSHRYLMSQALDLPLSTELYSGDVLPQAIALRPDEVAPVILPRSANGAPWLIWVYLSFWAAVWFNLVCRGSSPLDFRGARALWPWIGIVPVFFDGYWQLGAATIALLILVKVLAKQASPAALARWLVLPMAVGLACQGWGLVLKQLQPQLESVSLGGIAWFWAVAAVAGALSTTQRTRVWVMSAVFGAAAVLFHPVYRHYGFPATLAPLVGCWFVFYLVSLMRDGGLRTAPHIAQVTLIGLALFLMLQPFAGIHLQAADEPGAFTTGAFTGQFACWHAVVPPWNVANVGYMSVAALLAKLIMFYPTRPRWSYAIIGAGLLVGLQLMESRVWTPDANVRRAMLAGLVVAWAAAVLWKRPERRIFGLSLVYVLFFSFIALEPRNFMETSAMIGALAACSQLVVWFPQRQNLKGDYLILALFGLMVTGWASMRWSALHLEWHALFEWVSDVTMELHVGWFVPWIALKGLLPWLLILAVLRDRLGGFSLLPARALLMIFCAKVLMLLMATAGLAGTDSDNFNYTETACVVGVLTILYLGVVLLPRAWPARGDAALTPHPVS